MIDASGTWRRPNPAGADGLPALGERAAAATGSAYLVRQPSRAAAVRRQAHRGRRQRALGVQRDHRAGRGSRRPPRHADDLGDAARRGRRHFGGGAADELPQRGALGQRAKQAVEDGASSWSPASGSRGSPRTRRHGVVLVGEDGRAAAAGRHGGGADRVPARTCPSCPRCGSTWTRCCEAPRQLAAEIDPNIHSCGRCAPPVPPTWPSPSPDLYLVGMKSYGRAPTFLALTGYEQVRSVVAPARRRSRGRGAGRADAARHRRVRRRGPVRRPRRAPVRRLLRPGAGGPADRPSACRACCTALRGRPADRPRHHPRRGAGRALRDRDGRLRRPVLRLHRPGTGDRRRHRLVGDRHHGGVLGRAA